MDSNRKFNRRNHILKVVVVLIIALLPNLSIAQDSNLGNWLIYIGNKKIDSKWNLHHEIQYRNYNAIGDLEQLLLRTGLGYKVADNANLLLGYGFIHSQNYTDNSSEKTNVNEHRIFQQFITKAKVGILSFQHRYRFEQRFVEENFKMRYRYFLGLNVPLSIDEGDKTYLSAYNEIFINNKGSLFDRNRVYFGLGYKFNKALKMEVGYMTQIFNEGSRDQMNVLLFGNF